VCSSSDEVTELFLICVILPAALGPGVYSTSNRNQYQKIFLEVNHGRHVRLTTAIHNPVV
jgi:hypothetical protein